MVEGLEVEQVEVGVVPNPWARTSENEADAVLVAPDASMIRHSDPKP